MSMQVYLSENLKTLSQDRRITAVALATKINSNKSTIHNYFNGTLPQTVITLKKIADFFEVELDELVFKPLNLKEIKAKVGPLEGRYEIVIKKVNDEDN